MNIGWPEALVIAIIVIGGVALISTWVASRAGVASEKAKGTNVEQYGKLVADYEDLTRETREVQAAMQADLAGLREKVASIERMMREVG
jgi:ribosome-binding protein aMBF1 (putative translation factor)